MRHGSQGRGVLKHGKSRGQDVPDAEEVDEYIDWVVVVRGVEDVLLLEIEHGVLGHGGDLRRIQTTPSSSPASYLSLWPMAGVNSAGQRLLPAPLSLKPRN